jgi:Mg2+-importing ATPase
MKEGLKQSEAPQPFWHITADELLSSLGTSVKGLSRKVAEERLLYSGSKITGTHAKTNAIRLFLSQFKSPVIILLLFAAALSFVLSDAADTIIILIIVFVSGVLGFWQERGAADAVQKLLATVQIKTKVLRDGTAIDIPVAQVVQGDLILLSAGDVITGDSRLLESKDLFVDEACLTGETFPIEKVTGVLPVETALSARTNALFMGTHVVTGTATAVVVLTGKDTEFGKISETLKLRPPETEFERGTRQFGYLLMEVTFFLLITVFAINVFFSRPVLESLIFALALAVGVTPQLLPAIISVNLAHGAKRMAKEKVIVKRLSAIENFGSMNVLCSDKTGTLTEGTVRVQSAVNIDGQEDATVLLYANLNARFQAGYANPIDEAIVSYRPIDAAGYQKVGEVPYDFVRKRLSVLVRKDDHNFIVTKGALSNVLEVCTLVKTSAGKVELEKVRAAINEKFNEFSAKGLRTLGVAYREVGAATSIRKEDEAQMTFAGFLLLFDPLRPDIVETLQRLRHLGISLKFITGDNALVAANVSRQAGLMDAQILTGAELRHISNVALIQRAANAQVFAEVEPNQKERIILALKKAGNVVGYMGDGINDASALHAADVGISVANAVDVAKEAADIVLLEKDLAVLEKGVREGRVTFANTLKYIFMATSANFGNMFSMAGASLFLPFLPLLPTQILLTNLLTDLPEMTIATDSVDAESIEQPRRWDIHFIRRFMVVFGIVSSLFDYLTFGVLILLLHATPAQFRTGWFMESVVSASLIVLVVRTRKPFFKSRPGKYLLIATLLVVALTLVLPLTPVARVFEFTLLPLKFVPILVVIVALYVFCAELTKAWFYRRERKKVIKNTEETASE